MSNLEKLEKLYNQVTKKPKRETPKRETPSHKELYLRENKRLLKLQKEYTEVVAGNRRLADQLTDLARWQKLGAFILENATLLNSNPASTNEGNPPPAVRANQVAAKANQEAVRANREAEGIVLDFTEGNPRKYFAHNAHSGIYAYFAVIPDKMTKHNLGEKYHSYFTGNEDQRKAFRVIRSLETGQPVLTPKSGKRVFWSCARGAWGNCTCLEQIRRSEGNKKAAEAKAAVATEKSDAVAVDALKELQSLYGSVVETPSVEVETPPAAFTAFDPTRGTEVEYLAARRTARMCTNRGEKWSGYSGRGIPYSKMIDHGLSVGFTLEQMVQNG